MELDDVSKQSRQQRVGRYKVWLLQKRLAELSAQVEASVLEARQLILWKQSYQPLVVADLTDEDKRVLEHNHRVRLAEVVQKHCSGALKTITQHKWAFPFNNPVDTTRFPDYPKVITHPMDFSTIKARQDSGYYRDPKDWWSDIMLVFSNAKRYNAPGSDCYLMAQTLQEVSEEKYDKVIAPRLAEEAAATLRDEMYLKKKRAELVNQQIAEAMDAQCAVLFSLMAELHAAIREAKLLATSLCEPMTLEEKQALAATIQGLPTAQLESIVAYVASRQCVSEMQPGGGPNRKVQLNLGRYDPLLLRQLQHLAHTCTAARQPQSQQQQQQQQVATGSQRAASLAQPRPQAGAGAVDQDRSASASPAPSPGPGPHGAAGPASAVAQASAADGSAAAAGGGGAAAASAAAAAPSGQPAGCSGDLVGQDAAAAQQTGDGQQQAGQHAAAAAAAPPPTQPATAPATATTGTQRNISDVVTNATASGMSARAGIKWPGLAVGAGARARSRALLTLSYDGLAATAADLLSACPLPQPTSQRPSGRLSGTKRRAIQAAEVRAAGQKTRDDVGPPTGNGQPPAAGAAADEAAAQQQVAEGPASDNPMQP